MPLVALSAPTSVARCAVRWQNYTHQLISHARSFNLRPPRLLVLVVQLLRTKQKRNFTNSVGRAAEPRTWCKDRRNSSTCWPSVIVLMHSAPCIALLDRKGALVGAVLTTAYYYIPLELCGGGKARRHESSICTAHVILARSFCAAAADASLTAWF